MSPAAETYQVDRFDLLPAGGTAISIAETSYQTSHTEQMFAACFSLWEAI